MRKLKIQVQLSVDGFMAGPNSEMDWMTWNWDDGLKKYVTELTDSADTILLGRKMAAGFITHWESITDPADESFEFAKKMVNYPKYIFSKTLTEFTAQNATLVTGDLATEVNQLKAAAGKAILVYGGAGFAASLVQANLIDEYHLFINPAVIGEGMSIFKTVENKLGLKLIKATAFECGIVVLKYQLLR